jgi:hypothetical protein
MWWWVLIIFGCLLLNWTMGPMVALIALLCVLLVLWFAQMGRINFLLARIQEGVQKLEKIFQ